jgi:hypothetical protein
MAVHLADAAILLTAFKEKDKDDYKVAIAHARKIFFELEESDNGNK